MRGSRDLWRRLSAASVYEGETVDLAHLCRGCVTVLGVAGAAIALMDASGSAGAAYASDEWTARLQALQFTAGDGPIAEAYAQRVAICEADLASYGDARWPGFSPAATGLGTGGVFSFPLQIGAARLGVLTLYREVNAPHGDIENGDLETAGLVVAEAITRLILDWQAAAPGEGLPRELDDDAVYLEAVHQASGMISAQLEVGVGEALALLRARSFSGAQPIAELAADVINGRIRFDEPG